VYNILCDSVGMKPIPNNGTLRLPLKTVGLHEPDATIDEPEDPEPDQVSGESATTATSTSPAETISVTEPNVQPPTIIGVDPVDPPQDPESSTVDSASDSNEGPKEFKSWQDYWAWLTGKVDDLWHKLTGSDDEKTSG
jgi:hypothetical protein